MNPLIDVKTELIEFESNHPSLDELWPTREESEKARWKVLHGVLIDQNLTPNTWDAAISWLKQYLEERLK